MNRQPQDRPKVLVVLSCLHTRYFQRPAPMTGERVYCVQCGGYKDVAEAPHNYTVRCDHCPYGRECGNALIKAETSASKHALRRPGHATVIYDGEVQVGGYHHPPLPVNADDLPPF
jgi:hypothetical protein